MVADVLLHTLGHIWRTLDAAKMKMAVMGGIALASWKYVRATRDVDLLVCLEGKTVDGLLAELRGAGVRPRRQPIVTSLGRLSMIQCVYEPPQAFMDLQVDLLLAECPYQLQALDRRVPQQFTDLNVLMYVLACEDLILHKLLAGRIIDRVDCSSLIRLHRNNLDWTYLRNWAASLSVIGGLLESWQETFPGEEMP